MRCRALFIVVVVLVVAARTLPAAPATQPTSRPSASDLRTWFAELGDPDADVRAGAFSKLLGLTRGDLDGLRVVVEQSRPISPAQAAALHDVVVHVYLTAEPFEPDPQDRGFLGVRPLLETAEMLALGQNDAIGQDGGVPVGERLPGFCGFRALRPGDSILGVLAPRPTRLRRWLELQEYVQRSPGETLTFEVLRQGRVIHISVKLDPRPAAAAERTPEPMEALLVERQALAEDYWLKTFAGLLVRDVS